MQCTALLCHSRYSCMHAVMHGDGYPPVAGRPWQPRILTMPMLVKKAVEGLF